MNESLHFWMEVGILVVAGVATALIGLVLKKIALVDHHETKIAVHEERLGSAEDELDHLRSRLERVMGWTPHPRKMPDPKKEG
jgi:cytochrome c-type biogenesis protein CcmH/NrfG